MKSIAFIGSVGLPNRYGGFESFVENCAPQMAADGLTVIVTCDARVYAGESSSYRGVKRVMIPVSANGWPSVFHDLLAFLFVCWRVDAIVVLGVSAGPFFPLFRLLGALFRVRLIVNVDGVEWRRSKFGRFKRSLLWIFDRMAQVASHVVVYDNEALREYILPSCLPKATCIAYSGDHVSVLPKAAEDFALTVCRIEPENNVEVLLRAFVKSGLPRYVFVGNWDASEYGRRLRGEFGSVRGLELLDPIYDAQVIADYRSRASVYLHGHSVGGTNPSLVEMLFYDCAIYCLDVSFNRVTAADAVGYFDDDDDLARMIGGRFFGGNIEVRRQMRLTYTAKNIAALYVALI